MEEFGLLKNNRLTYLLLGIILLIHLGAFLYRANIGPAETPDSGEYFLSAQNAYDGKGFQSNIDGEPFREEALTRRPVGYPFLIYVMQRSKVGTIAVQTGISIATILLCLAFLKRYTNSTEARNIFLLGMLLTPSQFIYSTSLMSEIPFQFLLTCAFLSIILFINTNKPKWFIVASVILCAGFFTKPVLYPFTFLYFFVSAFYFIRNKKFILLPFAAIPVIAVLTFSAFNLSRTGAFEVSSIQATNLLDVNAKLVLYQVEGIERGDSIIDSLETEADKITVYPERQKFRQEEAKKILFKHPIITGYQFAKGCVLFFVDPGRFDLATYFGYDTKNGFMNAMAAQDKKSIFSVFSTMPLGLWMLLAFVLMANLAKIILFIKFLISKNKLRFEKIAFSTGILYIMFVSGSLGVSRYALPVVPLLLLGASLAGLKKANTPKVSAC